MPRPITEVIGDVVKGYDPTRYKYSILNPGEAARRVASKEWKECGVYQDYDNAKLVVVCQKRPDAPPPD